MDTTLTLTDILSEHRHTILSKWQDLSIPGGTPSGQEPAYFYNKYFDSLIEAINSSPQSAYIELVREQGGQAAIKQFLLPPLISWTRRQFYIMEKIIRQNSPQVSQQKLLEELEERSTEALTALTEGFYAVREHETILKESAEWDTKRLKTEVDLTVRSAQLGALHRIISAANSSLQFDAMLSLTVEATARVMAVDICSIFTYEREMDCLALRATTGLYADAVNKVMIPIGSGITGSAAREGKPIAVKDAWSDPRFQTIPTLNEQACRSMLAVPIILFTRDKLVGVITIQTFSFRDFTRDEIDFLEVVAGEISIAIENARLYRDTDARLRQKVAELTTLQHVSAAIAATLSLNEVLNLIVTQAVKLDYVDKAAIFELDRDKHNMRIIASHGLSNNYVSTVKVKLGEGAIGQAVQQGTAISIHDVYGEPSLSEYRELMGYEGFRSLFCIPLAGPRVVIGALCLYSYEYHDFDSDQIQILTFFANQAAVAIENARLYEETRANLDVKSAMLKEMHHRVRNNLQTVAALLSMQLRRARNTSLEVPLTESVTRIQSIAAVHDLLCHEDIGVTTVQELATKIVEIAKANFSAVDKKITFDISNARVMITSRQATLLSLLINELVQNAIFHGFANKDTGHITIRSFQENERTIVLISDDGAGIPPEFSLQTSKGLGLQIVQTLVQKDLGGKFSFQDNNGQGTTAVINFRSDAAADE